MNVSAIGNLFGVQQGPEKIDRKPAAETAGSLAFGTAETAGSLANNSRWLILRNGLGKVFNIENRLLYNRGGNERNKNS